MINGKNYLQIWQRVKLFIDMAKGKSYLKVW